MTLQSWNSMRGERPVEFDDLGRPFYVDDWGHRIVESDGSWSSQQQHPVADRVEERDWSAPIALRPTASPHAFPVYVLPEPLHDFVVALAEATQTPPDLAGVLVLAALATCTARRLEVLVRPGWTEPTNIFAAVALPPGNRKSAVFRAVMAPLVEVEHGEATRLWPEIAEASARLKAAEAVRDQAQARVAKVPEDEREAAMQEAIEAAKAVSELDVPASPRFIADDCSPERLASLICEQGGRMAVLSPEGDVFDLMSGRYSKMPNLGVYLRGHAGDPLLVDRVGRPPERVDRPALTLGLAVQNDVVHGLADRPTFKGRGLLARFLYAIPESTVGRRVTNPPSVPAEVETAYGILIRKLARLTPGVDIDERPVPLVVELDAKARAVLDRSAAVLEPDLAEHGRLGHIAEWGSKLIGAEARIAGLLHAARHPEEPWLMSIDGPTMEAAVTIGEYFIGHARLAFDLMGADPDREGAHRVLAWLMHHEREEFTKRELHRALEGRFRKVAELEAAIAVLVDHNIVRSKEPPPSNDPKGRGRRPDVYEVNPEVLRQNRRNRQKET